MCVGGCVTMLHECKCDCNGMRTNFTDAATNGR